MTAPEHYTAGGIETIDYIRAKLTPEGFIGYCEGNILKYQSRWRRKGGLRDLQKSNEYLGWLIDAIAKHAVGEAIEKLPDAGSLDALLIERRGMVGAMTAEAQALGLYEDDYGAPGEPPRCQSGICE